MADTIEVMAIAVVHMTLIAPQFRSLLLENWPLGY
jgi:hypothetical protein